MEVPIFVCPVTEMEFHRDSGPVPAGLPYCVRTGPHPRPKFGSEIRVIPLDTFTIPADISKARLNQAVSAGQWLVHWWSCT